MTAMLIRHACLYSFLAIVMTDNAVSAIIRAAIEMYLIK